MAQPRRGYQGKRYRLEDFETESVRFLTTDEVQVAFLRLERDEQGELPERCKVCRWRSKDNEEVKHND
jgi:hypothetical protein